MIYPHVVGDARSTWQAHGCQTFHSKRGIVGAVLVVEPKPSANLVAEPLSAMFCRSPPQAGSGRTYGCLFEKQAKNRLLQLANQQGTAELLRYVF